jgi:hypothetical protein
VMPVLQLMGNPRFYVVLPLTDGDAFLSNFPDIQDAGPDNPDIKQLQLPDGSQAFVKIVGNYAILSEDMQTIANHPGAGDATAHMQDVGPLGQAVMNNSDVLIKLNLSQVGPILQPFVAMGLAQAQMQMANDPSVAAEMGGSLEAAQAMLLVYGQLANAVLSEGQAMVIGSRFDGAGVTTSYTIQFKADTPSAQVFSKSSTAALELDRLPDQPYLFAMVMDPGGVNWQPIADGLKSAVLPQLPADSAARGIVNMYADAMNLMSALKNCQFAWLAPDPQAPMGEMRMVSVYQTDDPAAAMTKNRALTQEMADAVKAMAGKSDSDKPKMTMSYQVNADQLDGKPVDHSTFDMSAMQTAGTNPVMPTGKMEMNITTTDDAMIMASNMDLLRSVRDLHGGSGALAGRAELADARKQLPDGRFAEIYLDVGQMLAVVMPFMPPMDDSSGPTPPLAMGISGKDGGVGATIHAPAALIAKIVGLVQMMQGPPPDMGPQHDWPKEKEDMDSNMD